MDNPFETGPAIDDTNIIVFKDMDVRKYLYIFVKKASFMDEISLQFLPTYQECAERIVFFISKGCGWHEVERGRISVKTRNGNTLSVLFIKIEKYGVIRGL